MWFFLAFLSFLVGAVYLFHCLRKLDSLLERQEEKREILSLAFEEPAMADRLAYLLETFSRENPQVELVLHTDAEAWAAVVGNRAMVGFCGENTEIPGSLNALSLGTFGEPGTKVIWKAGKQTPASRDFTWFLWRTCGNGSGFVVE